MIAPVRIVPPHPASQMKRKRTVVDQSVKVTRPSAAEILEALPKTSTHPPFTSVHVQPEYSTLPQVTQISPAVVVPTVETPSVVATQPVVAKATEADRGWSLLLLQLPVWKTV